MIRSTRILGLLFWAFALVIPGGASWAQSMTVEVTGRGLTIREARDDATRQAMQAALAQLVVADRRIAGDEVIEDRIISTMSGFVERFEELSVRQESDGVALESRVTVSTERLANYIGRHSRPDELDGTSLFAEVNRELGHRQAAAELVQRAFQGFPSKSLRVKAASARLSEANPDLLEIGIEFQPDPTWVQALQDTLDGLAVSKASLRFHPSAEGAACRQSLLSGQIVLDQFVCRATASLSEFTAAARASKGGIRPICLVGRDEAHCYVLPGANYLERFSGVTGGTGIIGARGGGDRGFELNFLVLPITGDGALALDAPCCDVWRAQEPVLVGLSGGWYWGDSRVAAFPASISFLESQAYNPNALAVSNLYLGPVTATLRLPHTLIDTAATRQLKVVPLARLGNGSAVWDVSLGSAQPSLEQVVAEVMDESLTRGR